MLRKMVGSFAVAGLLLTSTGIVEAQAQDNEAKMKVQKMNDAQFKVAVNNNGVIKVSNGKAIVTDKTTGKSEQLPETVKTKNGQLAHVTYGVKGDYVIGSVITKNENRSVNWGKCALGTGGAALAGGGTGAVGGAGYGALSGTPIGIGAGTIIGGAIGAVGGGMTGAAASCFD